MRFEQPVLDLMDRTMFNLKYIDERCGRDGPYEITQLVNSFLGALAHPWENLFERKLKTELNRMLLSDAEVKWNFPVLERSHPLDYEDPRTVGHLLRLIRNSIAHGNIKFDPNGEGEISHIELWNCRPRACYALGTLAAWKLHPASRTRRT